jgi:hypothetical protein
MGLLLAQSLDPALAGPGEVLEEEVVQQDLEDLGYEVPEHWDVLQRESVWLRYSSWAFQSFRRAWAASGEGF